MMSMVRRRSIFQKNNVNWNWRKLTDKKRMIYTDDSFTGDSKSLRANCLSPVHLEDWCWAQEHTESFYSTD